MAITIEWRLDGLSTGELMQRIADRQRAFKRWGLSVAHAAKKSAQSHTQGGGFWPSIASHVRVAEVDAEHALVVCDHFAARQKEFGGTIRAKNAKALTIPIHELARGRRARDLELTGVAIFRPPGTNILATTADDGRLIPLYALVKSVRQAPEPWWPTVDEIAAIGVKLMREQINQGG